MPSNTRNGKRSPVFPELPGRCAAPRKEKELSSLMQSAEEHRIALNRFDTDRSLEENELSYLKADYRI